MDANLRYAWTRLVTAGDYERHMAAIGQAQAAAELTAWLIGKAAAERGGRVVVVGAGTGQMLEFLDPAVLRPYRLTFSDLNGEFLGRLRRRLERAGLRGEVVQDDIERTALAPGADLVVAALLLEHIDWRRGVAAMAGLGPAACGVIIQENPPGMESAVTPGRKTPPSIEEAMRTAHPKLVAAEELEAAFQGAGYGCAERSEREVADGKRLVGMLFVRAVRPV
jgi:SAM-dependent methyltransferase